MYWSVLDWCNIGVRAMAAPLTFHDDFRICRLLELCAFYDKCARYDHEYVGENHSGWDRRQMLLFDKYLRRYHFPAQMASHASGSACADFGDRRCFAIPEGALQPANGADINRVTLGDLGKGFALGAALDGLGALES